MIATGLSSPDYWADRLGLALTPLFERHETHPAGDHEVLLDGGFGSFALSVSDDRIWENDTVAAAWSWSSNLPHHVTVTDKQVAVVRWDGPQPELWTRSSVERQIEQFYRYLATDRVQSSQNVTNHMLMVFRRVRALVLDADINDDQSIDAYLEFLDLTIKKSRGADQINGSPLFVQSNAEPLLPRLSHQGLKELLRDVLPESSQASQPQLFPSLAVRHAGSEIFQEAHFELLRTSSPDLFGYVAPPETTGFTRGSTHFTPPALARTIVEQTLAQLQNLKERPRLAILDPACGSGSFLHEALRALRRSGFRGQLIMHGRDTSPAAISMAEFVLNAARDDWTPDGGCEIDLRRDDSLAVTLPRADVVLMNPPFVAWPALTKKQRQQVRDVLGPSQRGRVDLSMAFVTRALERLTPSGVLGTVLPGSVLTSWAAAKWREHLLDQANMSLIASLGEYGLFRHAQVQVAAAVLAKPPLHSHRQDSVTALVAGNDPKATGDALRKLRSPESAGPEMLMGDQSWRLFHMSAQRLRRRSTWRLTSPRTEDALKQLVDTGKAARIDDLFRVRQGVRTGAKGVFVLKTTQVDELPERERKWFLPAIVNESIKNGQANILHRVFYPYSPRGLTIESEGELVDQLPEYFTRYLKPARGQLEERASVDRRYWWGLSRRRGWALDPRPRIVSKFFGGPGSFATDFGARYIVVQGYAWFPKWTPKSSDLPMQDILAAYMAVMNSTPFARLLKIFSPHVAGGQFDLSALVVSPIPVPHLPSLAADERTGRLVARLAGLGNAPQFSDPDWRATADRLTKRLLGSDILNWV